MSVSKRDPEETNVDDRLSALEYEPLHLAVLLFSIVGAYLVTTPPVYGYGVFDQVNQLPLIKHAMDPTYLANDWVVGVRTGLTSPKFYYNQTVAAFADIVGLSTAVFLLYVASFVAIIGCAWLFTEELFNDKLVATLTVGMLLANYVAHPFNVPYPPDLGGNGLIEPFLTTTLPANALILGGLVYGAKARYRVSFALLGVATLYHTTNGFWIAVTVGLCTVAVEAGSALREGNLKAAVRNVPWDGAAVYGLVSSFAIVPLLHANLFSDVSFDAAYVMAWVRHPHHYIPSTWPVVDTAVTVAFILGSAAILYHYRDVVFPDDDSAAFGLTYVASLLIVMFLGGYVFTELIPVGTVIKLTPWRMDDFIYLVLYGGLARLAVIGLSQASEKTSVGPERFSVGVVLLVVLISVLAWTTPVVLMHLDSGAFDGDIYEISADQKVSESVNDLYIQDASQPDDLRKTYEWIESETPSDVVFLAPPSQNRFRLSTSRARVVNIKSFPFNSRAMLEWEQRMNAVCDDDIRGLQGDATVLYNECDRGFNSMSDRQLKTVANRYGATWLLTRNANYSFQHEYTNGDYHVYRINTSTSTARIPANP